MIVGLTGGIASGKSTVSNYLKSKNFIIVDADIISREVVQIGTIGLSKIIDRFGNDILLKDGNLNRKKLRDIIFSNKKALKNLNNILHPIIHEEILEKLNKYNRGNEIIIFDAPLLLENKLENLVDLLIVVSVDKNIQIERIINRDNISVDEAKSIINSQFLLTDKEKKADIILKNNNNFDELYKKIDEIFDKLKEKLC